MTLTATAGSATADSYITVTAADAFAANDLGPEQVGWAAATTDQKERALKRATRELDAYLRSGWLRYSVTQALLFPRAIDVIGTPLLPLIPRAVQLACYEQATYVLRNSAVLDQAAIRRARGLTSAAEPNVSYTRPLDADPASVLSPAALHYLEGYRTAGTRRGIRSVRMASGYLG